MARGTRQKALPLKVCALQNESRRDSEPETSLTFKRPVLARDANQVISFVVQFNSKKKGGEIGRGKFPSKVFQDNANLRTDCHPREDVKKTNTQSRAISASVLTFDVYALFHHCVWSFVSDCNLTFSTVARSVVVSFNAVVSECRCCFLRLWLFQCYSGKRH